MDFRFFTVILILYSLPGFLLAHDHSRPKGKPDQPRYAAAAPAGKAGPLCKLTLELTDAVSGQRLDGLVRIANSSGAYLDLGEVLTDRTTGLRGEARQSGWHVLRGKQELLLPRTNLKLEALSGLESELAREDLQLTGRASASKSVAMKRFFDARQRGLVAGNTHLHLQKLTRDQADEYLQAVPHGDGVDLVFVSYLERADADKNYISNEYEVDSLAALAGNGLRLGGGEEYRHNFGGGGEGYGHVMFLNLKKRLLPASLGPGITNQGNDGTPLRPGILKARSQKATVIWCHNTFGFEDIPSWAEGLVDAQNIFDGGTHGGYQDTFYRYLNAGFRVPFSTGTDWFMYDFSRVYVPLAQNEISPENWLTALASGKSVITNNALLTLEAGGESPGGTLHLSDQGSVKVKGASVGRQDFGRLQLLRNGKVIHETASVREGGHFAAQLDVEVEIDTPSWLALRIVPDKAVRNVLNQSLFAHTSPVYIELDGQGVFDPQVVRDLIAETRRNMDQIRQQGTFSDATSRKALLRVYQQGISKLEQRIENQARRGDQGAAK